MLSKEYNSSSHHVHPTLKAILNGIGGTLSMVSAIFTIMLMWQFSNSSIACFLYTITGICFQLCVIIFGCLTSRFFKHGRWIKGVAMILFSTCFMTLSITASMGYFSGSHDVEVEQSRKASDEYVTTKQEVALLTKQIDSETTTQSVYTQSLGSTRYKTNVSRSIEASRASVRDLQNRLDKARSELKEAGKNSPTLISESMFFNIAKTLNLLGMAGSSDQVKLLYFVSVSLLIDLAAIFCFSVSQLADKWMCPYSDDNLPDGTDPTSKRPSIDKKEPTNKESSSVQSHSSSTVSAALSNHSTTKNEDTSKDKTENNKNVSLALADSPPSLDSSSLSLSKAPSHKDGEKDARPAKKKKLPGIADTHVSEQKDSRYKRVVREVRSKRITASIRDIKAFAKCGEDVARRYREDMLKRGITMELPDGTQILKAKLKSVK